MKNSDRENIAGKSFRYMIVGMVVMIAVAIVTAVVFTIFIRNINLIEHYTSNVDYEKHYVFVDDVTDSEFWNEVYIAARQRAEEDGIYLENIRESLNTNYSSEDLLRVAINSSVDGIIYASKSSEKVVELINEASEKGVGVVILHNDIEQSARQCFVGVNNYELGQIYASQIYELLDGEKKNVRLLVSSDMSEGAANLVTLGIEDYLLKEITEEELPEIEIERIEAEDTFSVEEEIRKIFLSEDELPDIMLCLEGIYTQYVYQAVVDYNHVGDVAIIGYFLDKDILDAIDKKIIYSTVSVDTLEMGSSCIEALEEYNELGYTNSFLPISMEIIDSKKAGTMLPLYSDNAEVTK